LDELVDALEQIDRRSKEILMSQAELNTDVANLVAADAASQAALTDIATQLATILTEIQALQATIAAGGTVDLSGLEAEITNAQAVATAATTDDISAQADTAAGAQGAQGSTPLPVSDAKPADPTAGTQQTV
jgi:peptidoglycan hydrolase CwlO-like protein